MTARADLEKLLRVRRELIQLRDAGPDEYVASDLALFQRMIDDLGEVLAKVELKEPAP